MKVLINTMTLGKGGAERVISLIANSLIKNNDVMIVTNVKSDVEYQFDNRINIKSISNSNNALIRKFRKVSLPMLYRLKREILEYKPDVILSFLPEPSFRVLALKKYFKDIKNIPVIISIRNDPNTEYKNPFYKFVMKLLYPAANQVVLQTKDAKKYFKDTINYDGVVINNPVSKSFMVEHISNKRENKIVAVGRLDPQKNYRNMIDAIEIVNQKHRDYKYHIYGEGKLKKKLQKYINSKNLHDIVILEGKKDNIKDQIYNASAFIMSSDYEGMPNSLLEAACLGVPCISTNCPCGGPREILENGKNGILVPVNNSKELSMAICKIIENPKLAENYGSKAHQNSDKYNEELIIGKWKEEIARVIRK